MSQELHDIDDLFRNGLEGHEEDAPAGVWQGVSNHLEQHQASFYRAKYLRLQRIAWAGIALASIVVLTLVVRERREAQPATTSVAAAKVSQALPPATSQQQVGGENQLAGRSSSSVQSDNNSVVARSTALNLAPTGVSPLNQNMPPRHQDAKANARVYAKLPEIASERSLRSAATKLPLNSASSFARINALNARTAMSIVPASDPKEHNDIVKALAAQPKPGRLSSPSFTLSAYGAPNIAFERLEDDEHLAGPGRDLRSVKRNEKGEHSFSLGLRLAYEMNSRWSLQSGLSYSSFTTNLAPATLYAKPDPSGKLSYELHCASGSSFIPTKQGILVNAGDSIRTTGSQARLAYLTIPMAVSYRLGWGRFSLNPAAGLGFNILTSSKTRTDFATVGDADEISVPLNGLKRTYMDAQLGLGLEYEVNHELSFGLRPNLRLGLSPSNANTPVKATRNFMSMEMGIKVRL